MTEDNNKIVRTAKVRSVVTALFSAATTTMSASDVWVALEPKLLEIGTNKQAFVKLLEGMAKNSQIIKISRGRSVLYANKEVAKAQGSGEDSASVGPVTTPAGRTVIDLDRVTIADARQIYLMLHKMFGHEKR